MPALFRSADAASISAQRLLLGMRGVQVAMLLLAAVAGVYHFRSSPSSVDWSGVFAAIAFVTGALLETALLTIGPERSWYQGRAVAESVKTLAWRYAMRATPFSDVTSAPDGADQVLSQRFREILEGFERLELVPVRGDASEITGWMRSTRSAALGKRRREYLANRIDDQRNWYASKARRNHRAATAWSLGMVGVQCVGVVVAVLRAANIIDVDLLGVIAAISVAAVAWLEIRQHSALAQTYSVAAHELSSMRPLLEKETDDAQWSVLVDEAEAAISREHTSWMAARS